MVRHAHDYVNKLNREYRVGYMQAMRKLKPKKSNYPRGGYGDAVRAWRKVLSFGSKMRRKINTQNNQIILKGKKNRSK